MKIPFGTQLYGRLHRPDGSSVATRFAHLAYVPLIPLGSFRVARERHDGFDGARVGLSVVSVLAAYFKAWGFIAAVILICLGIDKSMSRGGMSNALVVLPVVGIALLAASLVTTLWFGTPPAGRLLARRLRIVAVPVLAVSVFFGYQWAQHVRYDREHPRDYVREGQNRLKYGDCCADVGER